MKTYQYWLLLIGLAAYVGTLGVLTADNVFHLGLFPSKLERILVEDIARLGSPDEKERKEAREEIISYHEFSVPVLLRAMDSGDTVQKASCAECLRAIASKYFLSDANYGLDTAAWKEWWKVIRTLDGLREERPRAREKAQAELAAFGRAAIPILIDTLRDPNRMVRVLVSDTLARIAAEMGAPGVNFGPDRDKWSAWWKAQQEGPKAKTDGQK